MFARERERERERERGRGRVRERERVFRSLILHHNCRWLLCYSCACIVFHWWHKVLGHTVTVVYV